MAITQAICNSYKMEVLQGVHSTADTYMCALYTSLASLDKTATAYTAANEQSDIGSSYVAGGVSLTGCTANTSGDVAYLDFNDPAWTNVTVKASGALIYNHSKGDKAVCVLAFGSSKASANGNFTINLPVPGANAIVTIT